MSVRPADAHAQDRPACGLSLDPPRWYARTRQPWSFDTSATRGALGVSKSPIRGLRTKLGLRRRSNRTFGFFLRVECCDKALVEVLQEGIAVKESHVASVDTGLDVAAFGARLTAA
jgi:hypothetical protein